MDIAFSGKIKNGNLLIDDQRGFDRHIHDLEDKKIQAIVRKYKTVRSDNQNRYYWGVVINILGNELGNIPSKMHSILGFLFLRDGGKYESIKSTSSLTTTEFEVYLESIRIWALSDLHITIPLPNEIDV